MRRFLEQYSDTITCIVFVLESCDLGIYEVLLPLYFPRNPAEQENARWQLPSDVGGMDGEPLLPDRQIRIIDNPQHALHGKSIYRIKQIQSIHIHRLKPVDNFSPKSPSDFYRNDYSLDIHTDVQIFVMFYQSVGYTLIR